MKKLSLLILLCLSFSTFQSQAHDKPWLDPDLKYPALDHIIEAVGHTQCVEEPKSLAEAQLKIAKLRYNTLWLWRAEYKERFPIHFQDLAYKRLSLAMSFLRELCGDEVASDVASYVQGDYEKVDGGFLTVNF